MDITKTFSSMLSDMGIDSGTQQLLSGSHAVTGSYVKTQVKGLAELEHALDALPETLARKVLVGAVTDASELFRATAESLAPENLDVRFGHPEWRTLHLNEGIKKAITVQYLGAAGARIRGEIALDKKHAFFGRFVEFGHLTRSKSQTAPIPFFRPAWESMKEAALGLFQSRLAAGVASAAAELRRTPS
jgi:HK97 gp10 family phage protein